LLANILLLEILLHLTIILGMLALIIDGNVNFFYYCRFQLLKKSKTAFTHNTIFASIANALVCLIV